MLLFLFAFYLLPKMEYCQFFFLCRILWFYATKTLIFVFFWFSGFTQLKQLFRNVYLKPFLARSLLKILLMFYSVANVSELQNFRSVYSQEHLLMADSDKNICDKQFDLFVFPRNLLKFGVIIVIGIPKCLHSKCCSNSYFWQKLLFYGSQSISFVVTRLMLIARLVSI